MQALLQAAAAAATAAERARWVSELRAAGVAAQELLSLVLGVQAAATATAAAATAAVSAGGGVCAYMPAAAAAGRACGDIHPCLNSSDAAAACMQLQLQQPMYKGERSSSPGEEEEEEEEVGGGGSVACDESTPLVQALLVPLIGAQLPAKHGSGDGSDGSGGSDDDEADADNEAMQPPVLQLDLRNEYLGGRSSFLVPARPEPDTPEPAEEGSCTPAARQAPVSDVCGGGDAGGSAQAAAVPAPAAGGGSSAAERPGATGLVDCDMQPPAPPLSSRDESCCGPARRSSGCSALVGGSNDWQGAGSDVRSSSRDWLAAEAWELSAEAWEDAPCRAELGSRGAHSWAAAHPWQRIASWRMAGEQRLPASL